MNDAKPLLVFVHGLASTPLDFGDQVSALPEALEATAPWLRGARPGATGETFDLVDAAADLGMMIELSGAPRTTMFGVGEGALTSLELALSRPDLGVDLVLVGPALATTAGVTVQRRLVSFLPRGILARRGVDKKRLVDGLDAMADVDLWGRLPQLTARTMLLVGERDRAGRAAAVSFADQASNADVRIEVIPGAGAAPHEQQPQAVNALLYEFIGVTPRH